VIVVLIALGLALAVIWLFGWLFDTDDDEHGDC
jgi:hypothetical protein